MSFCGVFILISAYIIKINGHGTHVGGAYERNKHDALTPIALHDYSLVTLVDAWGGGDV